MKPLIAALLLALISGFSTYASAQEYRLGDGDNIRIVVFQNPDLTLETRVSENGSISFPLIGAVKIGGQSIAVAAQTIATALKAGGFIQQPQVNIFLLKNVGNQVSVLGLVGRPGRFPLETGNTRLSEVIAIAGGISPAGADTAVISGTREGKPFHREIDIVGMLLDNKNQDDFVVAGGDVIYIQRQPMFYIYGEVQRPGSYRIERNMTIRQALAQSGGLAVRGTERNLGVHRRFTDGSVKVLTVTDFNNPVLPDDVFHVRESFF
jgi:polysaccharide export outer membrane protein